MILLKLIVFVIIIHAIYNLINFLRYPYIEKLLIFNYTDNVELNAKAKTCKKQILDYIKNSGVKDKYISITQPLGFGKVVSCRVSVFDNLLSYRSDIATTVRDLLLEAKGNYWYKFINSINPFYWIKLILYIPKNVLSGLGMDTDSLFIKLFQLVYWIIGIVFTIVITVFPDEVKKLILSFIHFS